MRWKRQWMGMGQGHLKSISSSCAVCFCDGINRLYCNFFYHNLNCHNANFIITLIILWFVKSKFGRWLQKKKKQIQRNMMIVVDVSNCHGFHLFFFLKIFNKNTIQNNWSKIPNNADITSKNNRSYMIWQLFPNWMNV